MSTALITGPTSGLGRQFAIALASRGHDLVLVSRDETRLQSLALELSDAYRIECEVLVADLSKGADTYQVEQRVSDERRPIDWLINNAGFGLNNPFLGTDIEEEQALLDVLVRAPMRITHRALPGMKARGYGRIVIVSSIASWITSGTYSAAKSWATVFTEGVSGELRGTDVNISALCPGFVRTEFHERADMDIKGIPSRMWLNADEVVATSLKDVDRGRVISVPSIRYQALSQTVKLLPRSLIRRFSSMPPALGD